MVCPICGNRNAEGARFCGSCGGRLTATCPHCLADVSPGLRFCNSCGGPLPEPAAAQASGTAEPEHGPAAERRLVSVLFVDLEDFTAIAESLDPEDVRNLQSRYFEAARSVVAHYGGTLEKFIGDAVMAVWGAPAAHEDDGERAVRSALELVAAVGKLRGPASDRRLRARAGVATGEAAVTLGVEGQGIVAGDLVNIAARLQASAPSNGVVVDETTRRVVGDRVMFEPIGSTTLKGKTRSVTTWHAVTLAGERPQGRAAGHSGSFVGRPRELNELMDLLHRTIATRRSRVVSVMGIAGIGKSRLIWEFEKASDALPDPVALHVGRAPSYGEGITFAPLAEMVRRRARITEGTETELARRQLGTTLNEMVPDSREREWIEPRLATLLDPGSDVVFERDELFAAWRRFFERVAEWAPALLIFEDLQWADPALLDFIDHLAIWSRSHPILIVTLARPELLDRRPTWGAGLPGFTAVHLEPLPDDAMAELLTGLAPDLPRSAVDRLVKAAGGVPLYGVEVLRMLVDRGQAAARDGGFQLVDPLDQVQIPETLHSLVSARIDALPAQQRGMLLSASVLGRRFHPDALAAISRLDSEEARDRIVALLRRELITVDDDSRSPGRGQLSFVQEVVRDVAYRTVSRRERRTLHLAAADYLEALRDEELIEAVAEHLAEAHRAAPDHPDAATVAARAVGALRQAAARALSLRAPANALTHLERALELAADDAARAAVWREAAIAARGAARFDVAEGYLRQLISWTTDHADPGDAIRARAQLASLLLATERHGSALVDLERAVEGIGDLASDPAGVELSAQLARAHVLIGHDQQALDWADRTLDAAQHPDLAAVAIDTLITRGTAQMRLGNDIAGLADLERAIVEAQRLGLLGAELRARNNLAWLMVPDDPHAALEAARAGLLLATQMGVGDMAVQLAEVVCAVAIDTGDWDTAASVIEEMRGRPQAPAHRIQFVVDEATLDALRGDPRAGAALDSLGPPDPETDRQLLAGIDLARAWIAFVDGRYEDAWRMAGSAATDLLGADRHAALVLATRAALWLRDRERAASSIARLEGIGAHGRAITAADLTLRAGAAALDHDTSAAQMYEEALAAWRALRLPLHLALCLADRHRLLPGAERAAQDAAEAEAILERLGAAGLVRQIVASSPAG